MATPALAGTRPPEPLGPDLRVQWMLDAEIEYLNHGCFGARPRCVSEAQAAYRRRFEARPIEFLDRQRQELIDGSKAALGAFLRAQAEDLGFVTNATEGLNAVLRSWSLQPGDELLTTNHVYNAVRNTMRYVAERAAARYVEIEIPLPVRSPPEITERLVGALTDRTRLVLIDHVSSPTAILFPIEEIVSTCQSRGVPVIVDGAHAPGMLDLDVAAIGAACYVGNLHKWVCAPVGAAFLWVRPEQGMEIHPTVISHFLGEGFGPEFDWQGTRDISPWLCVPEALAFMETLGWDRVRRHNHALASWMQRRIADRLGVSPASPSDGSMLGSMATVPLPDSLRRFETPERLQALLYGEHRIEVPIIDWSDRWWVRPSCQIYNTPDQYERLADVLHELALAEGREAP